MEKFLNLLMKKPLKAILIAFGISQIIILIVFLLRLIFWGILWANFSSEIEF